MRSSFCRNDRLKLQNEDLAECVCVVSVRAAALTLLALAIANMK